MGIFNLNLPAGMNIKEPVVGFSNFKSFELKEENCHKNIQNSYFQFILQLKNGKISDANISGIRPFHFTEIHSEMYFAGTHKPYVGILRAAKSQSRNTN